MIDNASQNEIHLSKIGYSEINKGLLYEFKVSDLVQKTTSGTTYTVMKDIVGDSRHDGKSFILAIQYKMVMILLVIYQVLVYQLQLMG